MLFLSAQVRADLERWVQAGYPHETCGVLVGGEAAGLSRVLCAIQARNRNGERPGDRYELDPGDHVAADMEARSRGLSIVGIWHSHPDHPAEPSETDRAGAWEGWSYLILSVGAGGVTGLRTWRLVGGLFEEDELRIMSKAQANRGGAEDAEVEEVGMASGAPASGNPAIRRSSPPFPLPPRVSASSAPPRFSAILAGRASARRMEDQLKAATSSCPGAPLHSGRRHAGTPTRTRRGVS